MAEGSCAAAVRRSILLRGSDRYMDFWGASGTYCGLWTASSYCVGVWYAVSGGMCPAGDYHFYFQKKRLDAGSFLKKVGVKFGFSEDCECDIV